MKLKKWLTGTVLSICLLVNVMAMPVASAGLAEDFLNKNFPSLAVLQEEGKGKSALLEGAEFVERLRELAGMGLNQLNQWGDQLKEKGTELVLDHFAGTVNDYVNEQAPLKVEAGYETRIVPVVTIGSKGYIGAAQVSGPKEQVEKCKAALTVEGKLASGAVRIQYLIPIDVNHPVSLDQVHRVQGVGITARLDLGMPE